MLKLNQNKCIEKNDAQTKTAMSNERTEHIHEKEKEGSYDFGIGEALIKVENNIEKELEISGVGVEIKEGETVKSITKFKGEADFDGVIFLITFKHNH